VRSIFGFLFLVWIIAALTLGARGYDRGACACVPTPQ
jgi:hypothetical protein